MTAECYYADCPFHSVHDDPDEGPYCYEPECMATEEQRTLYSKLRCLRLELNHAKSTLAERDARIEELYTLFQDERRDRLRLQDRIIELEQKLEATEKRLDDYKKQFGTYQLVESHSIKIQLPDEGGQAEDPETCHY